MALDGDAGLLAKQETDAGQKIGKWPFQSTF
jgi:hypothetical protein